MADRLSECPAQCNALGAALTIDRWAIRFDGTHRPGPIFLPDPNIPAVPEELLAQPEIAGGGGNALPLKERGRHRDQLGFIVGTRWLPGHGDHSPLSRCPKHSGWAGNGEWGGWASDPETAADEATSVSGSVNPHTGVGIANPAPRLTETAAVAGSTPHSAAREAVGRQRPAKRDRDARADPPAGRGVEPAGPDDRGPNR